MASSGYTAITFTANEQPTTAKWNLIGSNDASFNDGTGFEDSIILKRHLADNIITSEKMGTVAVSVPHASSFAVTTSNKVVYTATKFCFITLYIDYTSGGVDTTITINSTERAYLSPQRSRSQISLFLNPGDVVYVKAISNYTAGWLRVDAFVFN